MCDFIQYLSENWFETCKSNFNEYNITKPFLGRVNSKARQILKEFMNESFMCVQNRKLKRHLSFIDINGSSGLEHMFKLFSTLVRHFLKQV